MLALTAGGGAVQCAWQAPPKFQLPNSPTLRGSADRRQPAGRHRSRLETSDSTPDCSSSTHIRLRQMYRKSNQIKKLGARLQLILRCDCAGGGETNSERDVSGRRDLRGRCAVRNSERAFSFARSSGHRTLRRSRTTRICSDEAMRVENPSHHVRWAVPLATRFVWTVVCSRSWYAPEIEYRLESIKSSFTWK